MRISGTNIVTFDLFRFRNQPVTEIALKWQQVSSNNWVSVDRGAASDVYQSEISTYGTETEINNIIDQIEANRAGETSYFVLSQFNGVDDQIFGADIDYSGTLNVTVLKWGKRKQGNFTTFTLDLTLQLISTYVYDGTPSLPPLRPTIGYRGDSVYTIDKHQSYSNVHTYHDHKKDSGIFEAVLDMDQTEIKAFRRYIMATIRGGDMTITGILGVTNPFGPNRGGYPLTVKVLDFKDTLININRWHVKVKFAEVI